MLSIGDPLEAAGRDAFLTCCLTNLQDGPFVGPSILPPSDLAGAATGRWLFPGVLLAFCLEVGRPVGMPRKTGVFFISH